MLQDYVSPEAIGKLLRETKETQPPEVKHFQFVVILVDDTAAQDVAATIGAVMGTLSRHRATVSNITASVLVALLGVPFPESDSAEERRDVVDALLRKNGDRISIVHGQCDGPVGMFGGHGRWSYGAVIPGFSGILKSLLETKFGCALEIP